MEHNIFRGLGIALVTPFKADGTIDEAAIRTILTRQLEQGADFICILATTGEAPCLTKDEKAFVKHIVVDHVGGKVPVVIGCGGNFTAGIVNELKETDLSGIDGILSVCPFYNKPNQEGLYRHFRAIAEATPKPIILYNIESRTGVNMLPETMVRLANDCPNIVAVKEASGNLKQIEHLMDIKPADFDVLSGDDSLTYDIISRGGKGVISVVGNALTATFSKLVRAAMNGDCEAARGINETLSPLYKPLFKDGNPAGIKALLHIMGLIENQLRLPLVPACDATVQELRHWLKVHPGL
ncbi:MAG: 4-hydroxy-tetrahydrodipicolinate synthase [Prevotella sp.]|nr:4-hydroxy-tetrahydrodipicolinate synthase [Prevotella sp.]